MEWRHYDRNSVIPMGGRNMYYDSKIAFIILLPSAIGASQPGLMKQFELCMQSLPNLKHSRPLLHA